MALTGLGDPVSAGLGVVGLGLEAYGAFEAYQGAKKNQAAITQYGAAITAQKTKEIALEQQIEGYRKTAMEMDARRKSIENVRRARVAAATSATIEANQGAQRGSNVGGAYGQLRGEEGFTAQGISNSLELGESTFAANAAISAGRVNIANLSYQQSAAQASAQTQMNLGAGLSSLGGNLVGSMGPARSLFGGGGKVGI